MIQFRLTDRSVRKSNIYSKTAIDFQSIVSNTKTVETKLSYYPHEIDNENNSTVQKAKNIYVNEVEIKDMQGNRWEK